MTYNRTQHIYDELEPHREDIVASFDKKQNIGDCIESIKKDRRIIFETEDLNEGSEFLRILREIFLREYEQKEPKKHLTRICYLLDNRKENGKLMTGLKQHFAWLVTWLPDRYRQKIEFYK